MNPLKIYSLTVLILLSLNLSSQNISGKVVQTDNEKSIPFASVAIEGTTLGMVTNFEGLFNLDISADYINSKLIVSCIGFEEQKFDIIDIYGNNNLTIRLESTNVEIDEVVVEQKSLLPYTILKKAIHFIKDNYLDQAYNYELYYSNKDIRRDNKVLKREAVILMSDNKGYYKSSVHKTFKDINYRFLQSKRNFDVISIEDGNTNIVNLLEFDIARHSNNILNKDRLYDYEVVIKDDIIYKGESVWVLSYSCNNPNLLSSGDFHANFYSGEIFINKEDYAVLYNKSTVKSNRQSKLSRNLHVKSSDNNLQNAFYNYEVFYKKLEEGYVLDRIDYKIDYSYSEKESEQVISTEYSLSVIQVIPEKPQILYSRSYYEDLDFDKAFWAEFKK